MRRSGSSNLNLAATSFRPMSSHADGNPQMIAAPRVDVLHPAVILAKRPKWPFQMTSTFYCPVGSLLPNNFVSTAVLPSRVVATTAWLTPTTGRGC